MRRSCCSNCCCCRCCCRPLGPLVAQSACWCRGYMQRRLRGGHGKLTASSSSRERSAHDWKQHQQRQQQPKQQRREKRQKKFETESQMPKEPRDHDGFVAGVRVRVRVRVGARVRARQAAAAAATAATQSVAQSCSVQSGRGVLSKLMMIIPTCTPFLCAPPPHRPPSLPAVVASVGLPNRKPAKS